MRFDLGKISLEYDDDFQFFLFYAIKYSVIALKMKNDLQKSKYWWDGKAYDPVNIAKYYAKVVDQEVNTKVVPMVIDDLVDNGVYCYDEQSFINDYKEELTVTHVAQYLPFYEKFYEYFSYVRGLEDLRNNEINAREGKGGLLQSLGDAITQASDQAAVNKARSQFANAQETIFLMDSGILNLIANKVFACFCDALEKNTDRDADIILGRGDMTPYFNNINRIKGEDKFKVLTEILEKQPRDPDHLMYLLQEGPDLGLNMDAVVGFCKSVHPLCFYDILRGKTDETLIKLDKELPQLKRENAAVRVTRSTELLENLKSLVHYTDLYNIDSEGKYHFDSESDGIQELIGFESEAFLIYMAALEWIKSTAVNGYDLRSIGDYTYDYLNTLREEWKRIFKTYSLDSIKEVNRFTPYKNFIADGKKINDRMTAILRANAKAEKAKAAQNKALQANAEKAVTNTLPAPVQSTVAQKDPGIPLSIQDANTQQADVASASKQNSSAGKNKLPIIGIGVVAIVALIAFGAKGLKNDSYDSISPNNNEQGATISAVESHGGTGTEAFKDNTANTHASVVEETTADVRNDVVNEPEIYGVYSQEDSEGVIYAEIGHDPSSDYDYLSWVFYDDDPVYIQLERSDENNWVAVDAKVLVYLEDKNTLAIHTPEGTEYYLREPDGGSLSHETDYDSQESPDSGRAIDLTNLTNPGGYLCSWSSSVYLSEKELEGLTYDQARLVVNEIYARHGRIFNDSGLRNYFESRSWYSGTIPAESFSEETLFNEYERANVVVIQNYMDKQPR